MTFLVKFAGANPIKVDEVSTFIAAADKATKSLGHELDKIVHNTKIVRQIFVVVKSLSNGKEEQFLYTEDGDFQEI